MDEQQWVQWLVDRAPVHDQVALGIGDDAAVVRGRDDDSWLVCADALVDGVHFRLDETHAPLVGRKALAVNLSDIAAMGGEPIAATVCVGVPDDRLPFLPEVFEGLIALARTFNVALVGGDSVGTIGPMFLSVQVLGRVGARCWRRSGALPGDRLICTGAFGGSLAGRHLTFDPRLDEARWLQRFDVHAAIDVSDGLALDLHRLLAASGCGGEVWLDRIPIHEDAVQLAAGSGRPPLDHALADGEDFELLLAVDETTASRLIVEAPPDFRMTIIGRMTDSHEILAVDADGRKQPLAAAGFQHPL